MVDYLLPCDIGAFVTIQETIMRLSTIGLISTLVLGLLAGPVTARAQQAGKVYRIGYLFTGTSARDKSLLAAFQQGAARVGIFGG